MYFLNIPFPEKLETEVWVTKFAQLKYLAEQGILGAKFKNGGDLL